MNQIPKRPELKRERGGGGGQDSGNEREKELSTLSGGYSGEEAWGKARRNSRRDMGRPKMNEGVCGASYTPTWSVYRIHQRIKLY
jgi:hypothetical protein